MTTTDRAAHIYTARVYLAQVPIFRSREQRFGHRVKFSLTLLEWAGNARRRAMAAQDTTKPMQWALF